MLPEKFMLPDELIPDVRDQKKCNICVAMALTSVLQTIYYKLTGERKQFSPTWGAVMWRSDVEGQKNMASLVTDSAIPAMIETGAVFTEDCPELLENPEAYKYVMAKPELREKVINLVKGFEKINNGSREARVEAIKTALYENMLPIVAVVKEKKSSHCVPIIGWEDGKELFYVMNSWGKGIDTYKYEDLKRGYLLKPCKEKEEVDNMSNSPLVTYKEISPNKNLRKSKIDTITIHCVVGQLSVEAIGNCFDEDGEAKSANYGIGFDGRIGMYVPENYRSWCNGNAANDHRAITIEVACEPKHPYAVNDAAYRALIELLVDICKRNNIKQLLWKGDKSLIGQVDKQNMTVHRWFANKACPGDWLYERHGQIAEEVNKMLNGDKFTDIKGHWAEELINKAADEGIANGRGDGTFGPDEPITRAEAVALIMRSREK